MYQRPSTRAGEAIVRSPMSIHVQQLERGAGTQHERLSVIVREEDLAVHRDRRRRKPFPPRNTQPSLPQRLAGRRLQRGHDARHVVDHVELLAVEDRRRHERRTARARPREMRARHVAGPAGLDRQRRARASGRAEHHPVADDRRRDHLVRGAAAAPQLTAAFRVVRLHPLLAADDDLVATGDANGDRRAPPGTGVAGRPPDLRGRCACRTQR